MSVSLILGLCALACPVSMVVMMFAMRRNSHRGKDEDK
jgi:hypothetical protein